ncbi:MAG: AAA family ATPase [Bacteroidales bacterium]|nr:AAA family ATPase [Bacteroidales bacterium]
MFEILKKEIKVSDKVKLYLTSGKELQVDILEIGENYILVLNPDGTQSRFFEPLIGGWDIISSMQIEQPITITPTEQQVVNIETIHAEKKESENKIGLTILGKIDLDKIEPKRKRHFATKEEPVTSKVKVQPQKPHTLSQHIKEHNLTFTSLQNLQELKDKIITDAGKQTLPANATLKRFGQNLYGSRFGFLTDNENRDYYFNITDVYDDDLKKILNSQNPQETQVVCLIKSFQGKLKATAVCLPKTIEEFQSLAEACYKKNEIIEAKTILSFILNAVNDYEPALKLKKLIEGVYNKKKFSITSAASLFIQAKLEIKRGNIENGKKLFLELIETPNLKTENAVKELAYELQREGKLEEAIQITLKYQRLIKTSDPNSFLAYFYEIKKDYKTAIFYLEKVKPKTEIEKIKVDKRLAVSFFNIKDYDASELHLKKVIEKQPGDIVSQKLLEALEKIKSEGISDEIETIFNEAELASLTGGRSPHIQFALANCDYAGVPAAIVSEEKFTKTTLRELRKLIEEAGKARPKERAPYLLTEGKLMELLEPEREDELNSVLSRYCLAVSQNISSENNPVDIVRFYLLEAFKLSTEYGKISQYLPIYLHSFQLSSYESYKMMNKSIDETIKEIFNIQLGLNFWNGVIDLFLTNTEIFSQLLTRLFQNPAYQKPCVAFLINYLEIKEIKFLNKEGFSNLWNDAVDKRRREKEGFSSKFNSLGKSKTTESFSEAFESAKNSIPNWLGNIDKHRINSVDDILRSLIEFNTQAAFEDKERYFNIVGSQINTLHTEIEASPTEFSFNILRPQLVILSRLLEKEFKIVIQTSKPVISIKVLGESIIHDNNTVTVSINVSNKKGSAPISWFLFNINNSEEVEFIQENNESNQSLKGGDDKTLKLKIQVSQNIRGQGAFNLKVIFIYKIRGSEELTSYPENLAIRLYSESEFDHIDNPYSGSTSSGAVEDEKMFFGRTEFINNIKNSILQSTSKCVIIYGQKRSGKSSVLHHLKKQLNQSQNTFCISFSLGEIVENLSPLTFYYTVLSEIEDSLDALPKDNRVKPKFFAPTLDELEKAPSIIFNDYMKVFRTECASTVGWENKNLVLLIDEFTYIYTAIQKEFISEQFMKTWKSFVEKKVFSSILIGQDIMPKFMADYQNEFGIAEDIRLSYLSREDAIKLIEEPIWDKRRNRSRFLGKALDLILDYTSSNPYYIQIFCSRLVEYMNSMKAISVIETDVDDVAQTFIKGEQALNIKYFDNLITAGDADINAFNPEDTLKALKEIAFASKTLDSCSRDSIKLGDKVKEEQILSDLKTREVISCPQPGFYKIKVRLFKEWLLNN